MKVLFLDFDGVLNGENFLRSKRPIESLKKSGFKAGDSFHQIQKIDHLAVAAIHEFVTNNDLKIVFSTAWRLAYGKNFLSSLLCSLSPFDQDIFLGTTPDLGIHEIRGSEIDTWISENPVERFIIFDDLDSSNFLANQRGYHIKTEYKFGLLPEHIKHAEKLLSSHSSSIT